MNELIPATVNGAHEQQTAHGTIIIRNNSPSDIRITVNNVTHSIYTSAGHADTAFGAPLSPATLLVETVVTDPQGNPAGQQLVFVYQMQFPADSNITTKEINIPASYFFVGIKNQSGTDANQVIVTDPASNNSVSTRLLIRNSKNETACGYYPASTMLASVKVLSDSLSGRQWTFNNIVLSGGINQHISLTCD